MSSTTRAMQGLGPWGLELGNLGVERGPFVSDIQEVIRNWGSGSSCFRLIVYVLRAFSPQTP